MSCALARRTEKTYSLGDSSGDKFSGVYGKHNRMQARERLEGPSKHSGTVVEVLTQSLSNVRFFICQLTFSARRGLTSIHRN